MHHRKPLVIGNWKMNGNAQLVHTFIKEPAFEGLGCKFAICPPATLLNGFSGSAFQYGAQNVSEFENGAFTGELSATMLAEAGCTYVIIGHSERRELFGETNAQIVKKAKLALAYGLTPVICVGEPLSERESETHESFVGNQLDALLTGIGPEQLARCVIAYEPIWAIGTGVTATPEQAQSMHEFVRTKLAQCNADMANTIRLLYGGSVKPDSAHALFSQPDIDGGLIGGASLVRESFLAICQAAN